VPLLDLSFRFDAWFDGLPASPRDSGTVRRCVLRTGPGQRATPAQIDLEHGKGVIGDTWAGHEHQHEQAEIALINVHVLRSVAGGDESRMPLSGDQLHVDLDLSEANLPVGTLLRIGGVALRVSPLPHRPCKRFTERFGATAAKQVARANRRGRRGRGVLCTIESGGTIRVGDAIHVERSSTTDPR
jgi:MOSC domain-containing protein